MTPVAVVSEETAEVVKEVLVVAATDATPTSNISASTVQSVLQQFDVLAATATTDLLLRRYASVTRA
jgi:hypothetical protein